MKHGVILAEKRGKNEGDWSGALIVDGNFQGMAGGLLEDIVSALVASRVDSLPAGTKLTVEIKQVEKA